MIKLFVNATYEYYRGNELETSSLELDYEQFTEVMLRIIVSDGNHTSNCSLDVNITDVNDNRPLCGNPRQFAIPENTDIGKAIGTVNVRLLYS